MVRQWQTSFYGKRYSNTDPQRRTDFVKLAEAFGAKGYRATNIAEFKERSPTHEAERSFLDRLPHRQG